MHLRRFGSSKRVVAVVTFAVLVTAGAVSSHALAAGPPTATTGPALSLTTSSANLTGTVNPNGESTTYSFQLGPTTGYGLQSSQQSAGSGTENQVVSANITGLTAGTTYHYRVIATNASATTVGEDLTFTTLGAAPPPPSSPAPTATTRSAVAIGRHGATLRGTVNPKGARTTFYFELGQTPAYGTQTPRRSLAAGSSARAVSVLVNGLKAGTTYHYRIVATNANGVALGADRTFTTASAAGGRATPGISASARPRRDRRRPFEFTVRGRVIRPAGVSRTRGCRGRVRVRLKLKRKTVGARTVRVRRTCRYRAPVTVTLRKRSHPVKLRVLVRFRGNAALNPVSAPRFAVRAG